MPTYTMTVTVTTPDVLDAHEEGGMEEEVYDRLQGLPMAEGITVGGLERVPEPKPS